MKLSHIVIASTAVLSFGALAEGNKATDSKMQSGASATLQHSSQASASVVKQAQQKLSAAGHDAGAADGVMGPKTAQALKDFQHAKGIEASGQLDQRTLAELGIGSSAAVGASAGSSAQGSVGASKDSGASGSTGGSSSTAAGASSGAKNESGSSGPTGSASRSY